MDIGRSATPRSDLTRLAQFKNGGSSESVPTASGFLCGQPDSDCVNRFMRMISGASVRNCQKREEG